MKNTNYVKLVIDAGIAVLLILMFNRVWTGQQYHEVAGLVLGLIALVHVALNWSWVKNVTVNFFKPSITARTRVYYLLDLLLFLGGIFMVISGLSISKTILVGAINLGSIASFRMLHELIPYLGLLLVGIHVGLHWNWVMVSFRRLFGLEPGGLALRYALRTVSVLLMVFGLYSCFSTGCFSRIAAITSINSVSQPSGRGVGMEIRPNTPMMEGNNPSAPYMNGNRPSSPAMDGDRTNAQRGDRGPGQNGGPGSPAGRPGAQGAGGFGSLASYLSILSLFAIVTYYWTSPSKNESSFK